MRASDQNNIQMVRLLLDRGANPTAADKVHYSYYYRKHEQTLLPYTLNQPNLT